MQYWIRVDIGFSTFEYGKAQHVNALLKDIVQLI